MSEIKNKKTKTEDNKIEVKIPRLVWWISLLFFVGALSLAFISAIDATKEWIGLSSICLALSAAAIAYWRMDLIHKQNELTNKNIEIQQQVGHRQNYFASIEYLKSESVTIRIGAIHELGGQLETDERRQLQIIDLLSSTLYENTIQGNEETKEERKDKIDTFRATLDALACRKPEWLPLRFRLNLSNITFNMNTGGRFSLNIKSIERADLQGANFKNTDIDGANFEGASLYRANFEGASLIKANFTEVNLDRTNFKQAVCKEANFEKANLCGADLSQATGITQEQIDLAFGGGETKLPLGLKRPPHWPPIKLGGWQAVEEWQKWMDDPEGYIPPNYIPLD